MKSLKFDIAKESLKELADCSEKLVRMSRKYSRIKNKAKRKRCKFWCYEACTEFTRRVPNILKHMKIKEARDPQALIGTMRDMVRFYNATEAFMKIKWDFKKRDHHSEERRVREKDGKARPDAGDS